MKVYKNLLLVLILSVIGANLLFSQIIRPDTSKLKIPRIPPIEELRQDINYILDNPDLAGATISILVQSLENGEIIFKREESKNCIPASLMKLITTSSALYYLGTDYKYKTQLYLDGTLQPNGEFIGNIIIRGSGDPSISDLFMEDPIGLFEDWAWKIDSIGIRSIKGNLIADHSFFDENYYPPGWSWDDFLNPYSAQVSALSVFDNKIKITAKAGDSIDKPAKIFIFPENNYVQVINNINTVRSDIPTRITKYREPHTNIIELAGSISLDTSKNPKSYELELTIDNPPRFFLTLLKEALLRRNIKVRGNLIDVNQLYDRINYNELNLIHEHISPSLNAIIANINKHSHNLGAELLLKTIAKEKGGDGSFRTGIDFVKKFCSKIGIDPERMNIVDGSGLSRYNLISSKYIVNLLSYMYRSTHSDIFINSLAEPNKPGTLTRRMTRSLAENKVKAKTGTLNNISNLAGYIWTRDDEPFAFCIMIMNFTSPISSAENLQDLICMRLASFTRKKE